MTSIRGRLIAVVATCLAVEPAWAYLKIHPSNPHYFQETTTGEAVMITTYWNTVPEDTTVDYTTDFRLNSQAHRMMYNRVWDFTPFSAPPTASVWPWAASGTGGAYWGGAGGNKLDMNVFNTTYFTRLNDAMARANNAGIYQQIMLFDRVGMSPAANDRWGNNPWAANNNINSLEVPNAQPPNDGTPEFYGWSTRPNLKNQQERYVRQMIDQTIAYGNILYEIENEHWQSNSVGWADHYGQFVKDYITANYPTSPRLVSYSSIESDADLDQVFAMTAVDIVSRHYGGEPEGVPGVINGYIEPRWGNNKPINVDEFANGVTDTNILRPMCWETITSGGHFHIEDADPASLPYDVVDNINAFKAYANWNFIAATPNHNLITSGGGFCLAHTGEEYVCYFNTGGNKTVNLTAATYRSEWWNPRTGGFSGVTTFTHGGGGRTFATPDGNDWVLHVTTRPVLNAVLDSKPAGTITIDGNSADWNLSQFVTGAYARTVGTGDIAIIGFNGFENWTCYAGAHALGLQFPPADASDHAVWVYSRHDTNNLYFLVRINDSDRQTGNPVGSNWANDCVEFYIDPGNAGGASPMNGSSTSDVQLVIDAANQKNVYMCTAGYASQVLAGVTSAVTTDATGWWLEVRLAKTAFSPAIPSTSGTIGIDFNFRDNDNNNNPALTTVYAWHESSSDGFPIKIPDHWGDLNLSPISGPPGQATNPSPANGATGVAITSTLSWTAGSGTTSHNVRFGTANPPPFIQNQAGTTYNPGTLSPNTTYFWRIDEQNGSGTTTGVVWSFTTLPLPGAASNPSPANGATGVNTTPTLTWTAGSNATSHDVRFGTANPPPFIQNQAGTSYAPGTLAATTTYFWRIDEKNSSGTTTGTVWSFTTGSGALPPYFANSGFENGFTAAGGGFNGSVGNNWTAFLYGGVNSDLTFSDETGAGNFDTGAHSQKIQATATHEGGAYNRFTAVSGNTYTVTVRCKSGSPAGIAFLGIHRSGGIDAHESSGTIYPQNNNGNTSWQTLSWTGTATGSAITVFLDTYNGVAYWDTVTPPSPPTQASNPNPANAATGVSTTPTLTWTTGAQAASHDVRFGTTNPPPFVQNQAGTSYVPGTLANSTTYFWRIDEINTGGTTTGTVWSFTTAAAVPPGQATNPNPANGATGVALSPVLSWTAGSGATSHNVRFGTANPPPFIQNQAGTTYSPGTLAQSTTYFWRIDEQNASGTTTGVVWSFTTGSVTPDGVWINLGATNIADRMTDQQGGDGDTTANTVGGRTGRRNVNTADDFYFYFGVADSWAFQGNRPDVYIIFTYYDSGTGTLQLQYDSIAGGAFKAGPSVTLTNTNTWLTASLHVTDAYFGNRTNGVDFRIFIGTGVSRTLDLCQVANVPSFPPAAVSVDMGTTDVVNGLTNSPNVGGDADTTPATIGGRTGRRNVNTAEDFYFYFTVSDNFTYQGTWPDLYIKVDYYDTGTGSLLLQYESPTNAYASGPSITLTNTNTWKQASLHVTDAYFANGENSGADFRIFLGTGVTRYLDIVSVSTTP